MKRPQSAKIVRLRKRNGNLLSGSNSKSNLKQGKTIDYNSIDQNAL